MKKFAIGFILYNPKDLTIERLRKIAPLGYTIYIFDNSVNYSPLLELLCEFPNVKYCSLGFNAGIGLAMRWLALTSLRNGFNSILYFDQDTAFNIDTLNYIENFNNDIYLFGTCNGRNFLSLTFRDRINRPEGKILGVFGTDIKLVNFTISSGTLFNLISLRSIDFHDRNLFIDGVDYEICLKARNNNLIVGEISNVPGLDHTSEQADEYYSWFSYGFRMRKYPFYRIKDTLRAYTILLFRSIKYGDKSFYLIIKFFLAFAFSQLLVRLLKKQVI